MIESSRDAVPATSQRRARRDFHVLLAGQWAAQAADGMAQAALADILLLEPLNQGAPARVLGLFVFTLLPYSVIAPFLGVFVDRWTRRELMVWTNVARAVLVATLVFWSSPARTSALFTAALALLGLGRLFLTTKGAVLPVVLAEQHLLRGNALSSGGGMIAALLGGVVGLVVVGLLSGDAAFATAAVSYCGAGLVLRTLSKPMAHPDPSIEGIVQAARRVGRELIDGLIAIWRRRRVRLSLTGIFLLRTVAMFVAVAAILMIRQNFPAPQDRFGRLSASAVALGCAGAGALLGAVVAPAVGRRLGKSRVLLLGFVAPAAALLLLGGVGNLSATLGLTFAGGFGAFLAKIAVAAQVQEGLPNQYGGRAFSLYDVLYNLASVVAAAVMVLSVNFGFRTLFVVAGVSTCAMATLLGVSMHRADMLQPARSPQS